MKRFTLLPLALFAAMTIGCAHQVSAPIPGSLNSFDSTAYQTLMVSRGIAQSFSDQACSNNGGKPGCFAPSATEKTAINQFIADLNIAETVYVAYHQGAQPQAAAQAALSKVTADQASLPANIKGK